MAATSQHEVAAISRASRLALDEDDVLGSISNFLDACGDECSADDAVVAIVSWPDGSWGTVRLECFETRRSS